MTITGFIGDNDAGACGGNMYDQAYYLVSANQPKLVQTYSNFFNSKRIPGYIHQIYPDFSRFVEEFFKWLSAENEIGIQEIITDIDTTPDLMIKLFKSIYANGFPDQTFDFTGPESERGEVLVDFNLPNSGRVDVRNFLANCKDLYQYKGTPESFEYFLRVFFDSDSTITEPKTFILRCSDAPYRGVSAGTTGSPCYHWGMTGDCLPGGIRPNAGMIGTSGCPTGPCWTDTLGRLCWAGGSYDDEGFEILPPCDKKGCAPGSPCGVYYDDELGTLSGLSRIQDSKYWQNYSYLIDAQVPVNVYLPKLKQLLNPAGLYIGANYSVWDDIPQPGTTGEVYPVEQPVIGNYAPYRLQTYTNLRSNNSDVDLYPCGYNPDVGGTYTSQHTVDNFGLHFKNEDGSTGHQPYEDKLGVSSFDTFAPLGKTGHTGGTAAAEIGFSYFRVYHHPSSWSFSVPSGISFGAVNLGDFLYLSAINTSTGTPNDPADDGSGTGCP